MFASGSVSRPALGAQHSVAADVLIPALSLTVDFQPTSGRHLHVWRSAPAIRAAQLLGGAWQHGIGPVEHQETLTGDGVQLSVIADG
jgi:hypothetical protein